MRKQKFYIGPEGPHESAQLAIVAEKPGKDEHAELLRTGQGRPLIGSTGQAVDRHLSRAGSGRPLVYLTNVIKHYDEYWTTPSNDEILEQLPLLYKELASMPNLNCIVAMGAVALKALSCFQFSDIGNRRGSILESIIDGIKMVPTYHPAFYQRGEWRFKPVVEFDLMRAVEQSKFHEIRRPERTYYINPTFPEALEWLGKFIGAHRLSYDIETFRPGVISCIALASEKTEAYCIPFCYGNRHAYWSIEQETVIWKLLQRVLNQPTCSYIAQNGLFDSWHLWRHGIEMDFVGRRGFDSMYAHRMLMPGMPHDLGFLTSIYTEEPYYKDESGDWKSEIRVPDEQFWIYNAKDSAVTIEVADQIISDMKESNQFDYYTKYVQPQWDVFMDMRKGGIRIDTERLKDTRASMAAELSQLEEQLKEKLGWLPNVESYLNMGKLFEQLGIKPSYTMKTHRPRFDEGSMAYYAHNNISARPILVLCNSITKHRTLMSSFLQMHLDDKGFYHPFMDVFKTKTGRAASKGADGGGPQIQNIPKSLRKLFIADDDESEIICADLKQAEKMYVAWEAEDLLLLEAFRQKKDVHRVLGCIIFRNWHSAELPPDNLLASILKVCPSCGKKGETECNHSERYMAKQSGHAFSYMQGERRFIREQAKKNVFIEYEEAKRIRALTISKAIHAWHDRTYSEMRRSLWFENPLGLRREFYGLPDDEMLREILSWEAQSTVGSVTTIAMLRLARSLPEGSRLLTQTHDSVAISTKKDQREQIYKLLDEAFYVPMTIHGRELVIPLDKSHGPSWGEQYA